MLILFTSALTEEFFEKRKIEYLTSYQKITELKLNNNTCILECLNDGINKTFLDDLDCEIYYTGQNFKFKNKGVNEILNINWFLQKKEILEDEFILKITGRYLLINDSFINTIDKFSNTYDVILRRDNHGQVFFGCLGMKKKVLVDFINSHNWLDIESRFISIELVFSNFLKTRQYKILEVGKINIYCNINNNDINIF